MRTKPLMLRLKLDQKEIMDWTKKTFKQLAQEKKKKRVRPQARKRVGPPKKESGFKQQG